MNEITLNILEDDRKLTKFIIDYFNITDIKITNGKESLIKDINIKIVIVNQKRSIIVQMIMIT